MKKSIAFILIWSLFFSGSKQNSLSQGLAAYFPMKEGGGRIAKDVTGLQNTGIFTGSNIAYGTLMGRKAAIITATTSTDGYINCGTNVNISFAELTISAWVCFTSFPNAYMGVVSKKNNASASYFSVFVTSAGKVAWYLRGTTANIVFVDPGSTTLSANKWYNLVLTYNTTTGLVGYVNTVVDATAAANGPMGGTTQTGVDNGLGLGSDYATASRFMAGAISDVRIWGRCLTPTEVRLLYVDGLKNIIE